MVATWTRASYVWVASAVVCFVAVLWIVFFTPLQSPATSVGVDAALPLPDNAIAGRVVDDFGAGVPGVVVEIRSWSRSAFQGFIAEIGELGVLKGPVPPLPLTPPAPSGLGAVARTMSGPSGYFEFAEVPPGRYRVGAFHSDYMTTVEPVVQVPLESQRKIEIVLYLWPEVEMWEEPLLEGEEPPTTGPSKARFLVQGRVYDPGEHALSQVHVQEGNRPNAVNAVSDSLGRFALEVANKDAQLMFIHPSYPTQYRQVSVDDIKKVMFPFGGGVDAQVRDKQTLQPLSNAKVTVRQGQRRHQARSTNEGVVRIVPMNPGVWQVTVHSKGYAPLRTQVDVPKGRKARAFTIWDEKFELEKGVMLRGVVRDRYGERVATVPVTVLDRRSITDKDGQFVFHGLPSGRLTLVAKGKEGEGTETVEVAPGDKIQSLQIDLVSSNP